MGNIQTLHDTGSDYPITPKMDGGVYSLGATDCVIQGIGDEFALQYSSSSLDVQFNAGSQAVIGGAFFKVMSLTTVTLPANSTVYLCANIDTSKASGSTGSFTQRTSSNMQSDNLNGSGTSRDLLLYVIATSASGVSSVTDRRTIKSNGAVMSFSSITNVPTNVTNLTNGAIPYQTSAPSSANNAGLKVVYLTSTPSTFYNGYLYLIKE